MSWTQVIWLMSAGACITLAVVHLLVRLRDRNAQANLVFAAWTAAVAVTAPLELAMMHASTPEKYTVLLGATAFPFAVTSISYIMFIRLYLQTGRWWLVWSVSGIVVLELLVKVSVLPTLPFVEIADLHQIPLWGDTIAAPVGMKSPWSWITGFLVMSELAFIGNAAVEAWRKGRLRRVKIVAAAVCCSTVFSVAIVILVLGSDHPTPIVVTLSSMITILVMAYGLSSDLFKASQISQDLHTSQERLSQAARAANLGIWEWDMNRDEIWHNDVGGALIGAGTEGFNVDRFLESVHPDDREPTRRKILQAIEHQGKLELEYRVVFKPDGGVRWVSANGNVEFDLHHKPVRLRGVSMDITERKLAEEALKESEAALKQQVKQVRTILDTVPNYIFAKDIDGRFLLANKAVADVFGVDSEQVVGKTDFDYGATEEQTRTYNMVDRSVIESQESLLIPEERIMRKDGTLGWFQTTKVPYHHPGYDKPAILGVAVEITERKQAEQELQKNRDYLAHLINSIPDAVFSVKLPERTIEWARDSYNVLGHDLDTFIGKTMEGLYSNPEGYQAFGELLKNAVRDNKDTVIAETMLRNRNGESIPVEINTTIYRDKGEPVSVITLVRDISDRKKSQQELEKSEARLKDAQRIACVGNWELDLMTNTLIWSDEIFRIFEIDKDRFGASYEFFLSTIHPEDREAVNCAYMQSLETHKPCVITHRLLMADGGVKYVQEQCETFYSPEGNPLRFVCTVQDITQEKQAEIERTQLRNDLAHAQRVSTLGHISSALAHELNQPLGAILNNASAAQILKSQGKQEEGEFGEILADIISDTRRAGQVVRKIRGIVKKTEVTFEPLNVNALIEEVVALYQNVFNLEKISSSLDLQPELLPVRGDRVHLQQVLMNLINNADEAMRKNSSKTLKIRSIMPSADKIIVSVIDSGTGIDEAKKEKVFDYFFSSKKDGLGLGLGICRSIIEDHGGRIWVENNPAGGAIFSFFLETYRGDAQ